MFKKVKFSGLDYSELDRLDPHGMKRDELQSFYQTFDFLDLIKQWPNIIGPKLNSVTSPMKLKQDTLFIITKHSSFSHELMYRQEDIKSEIFKVFPRLRHMIKKISFQTQETFFEERNKAMNVPPAFAPGRLHPQSPQFRALKLEAERLFSDIEDPELRSSLISIFIQSK
jgi:hypothetical protein